jgi:hypothetical protein
LEAAEKLASEIGPDFSPGITGHRENKGLVAQGL